jgi:hypothetical protein
MKMVMRSSHLSDDVVSTAPIPCNSINSSSTSSSYWIDNCDDGNGYDFGCGGGDGYDSDDTDDDDAVIDGDFDNDED